jgi:hypothetical protein
MTMLIVHGWAHRVRDDGIVESAPVREFGLPQDRPEDRDFTLKGGDWRVRHFSDCGLSGSDFVHIKKVLETIRAFMPEPFISPSSEVPTVTSGAPDDVR